MKNLSEKISTLRKVHNMTQETLGEAVGVSAQAVSKWEKGDSLPDISIIPDICKVFGISADTLIGNERNITGEMYIEKAIENCTDMAEKIKLLHIFMSSINGTKEKDGTNFYICDSNRYMIADSTGYGMYINSGAFVEKISNFIISKSRLLDIINNEKSIKIIAFIIKNNGIDDSELSCALNISEKELNELLFLLIKDMVIQPGKKDDSSKIGYFITQKGLLVMNVIANFYLFDSTAKNFSITYNHIEKP